MADKTERKSAASHMREWIKSIVIALAIFLLLRTFLIEAFRIPSGSMENTLLIGDFLFVNKALYGAEIPFTGVRLPPIRDPERGDLVIFRSVEEERLTVVKRIIGVPGDTLAMVETCSKSVASRATSRMRFTSTRWRIPKIPRCAPGRSAT